MTRRWSLRTRFVVAASLCLLPLVGVALFLLDQSLQHSQDQLVDAQFAISDVVAQGLTATLSENQVALQNVAEDPRIVAMDATQAQEPLDQVRQARPSSNGLFLLTPDKQVVATAGGIDPLALLTQFQDDVDRALAGGELGISDRLEVPESDVEVIALVAPVLPDPESAAAEGETTGAIGAVGAFLAVERIEQVFLSATGSASGETTIAVVTDGGVIAEGPTDDSQDDQQQTTNPLDAAVTEAIAGKRSSQIYEDSAGNQRLAVVAPLNYPGVQWAITVSSPSPMTYGPNRELLQQGLIALAGAVVLTLILAVVFGELTARPLRQLTDQAAAISHGDLSQPLQPVGRGEVATLSSALGNMADRLTTQVRDTEAAREELARQAERLRELLRRTVRLQEDERRRIASEIHDAVSPLITGALYQTRAMALTTERSNGDPAGADGTPDNGHSDGLGTVGELLEKAMAELHDVIFALRPPDLDDLGVVAAIDRYVRQINRTGLPCELEVVGEPQRLSPEARLGVYRIVQEALHNALRHAHADEALVRMEWLDDRLRVTIRDNGSGFDPEQAAKPTSLGLLSMRERAAAIGGTLEIASRPGTGTAVILERTLAGDLVTEPLTEQVDDEPPDAAMEPVAQPEAQPVAEVAEPVGLQEVRSA